MVWSGEEVSWLVAGAVVVAAGSAQGEAVAPHVAAVGADHGAGQHVRGAGHRADCRADEHVEKVHAGAAHGAAGGGGWQGAGELLGGAGGRWGRRRTPGGRCRQGGGGEEEGDKHAGVRLGALGVVILSMAGLIRGRWTGADALPLKGDNWTLEVNN